MIVSAMNQKGGVGKTSTCYHLAGALSKLGKRVLLVDNDPQASLTQGHLGPAATAEIPAERTIAAVYAGDDPMPGDLIRHVDGLEGVDLIPSGYALNAHNLPDPFALELSQQQALALWLEDVARDYDATLIDCPPNLCLCSWASLLTADALVVPVQPEDFGAQGLGPIRLFGRMAREHHNPRLRMLGYLVSMFDGRTGTHKRYRQDLQDLYGDRVFANPLPRLTGFTEAIAARQPVSHHDPKGKAAAAVAAVAGELLERYAATPAGGGEL